MCIFRQKIYLNSCTVYCSNQYRPTTPIFSKNRKGFEKNVTDLDHF